MMKKMKMKMEEEENAPTSTRSFGNYKSPSLCFQIQTTWTLKARPCQHRSPFVTVQSFARVPRPLALFPWEGVPEDPEDLCRKSEDYVGVVFSRYLVWVCAYSYFRWRPWRPFYILNIIDKRKNKKEHFCSSGSSGRHEDTQHQT